MKNDKKNDFSQAYQGINEVKLTKTSSESGEVLPGVIFELCKLNEAYDNDAVLNTYITQQLEELQKVRRKYRRIDILFFITLTFSLFFWAFTIASKNTNQLQSLLISLFCLFLACVNEISSTREGRRTLEILKNIEEIVQENPGQEEKINHTLKKKEKVRCGKEKA